ncbi:MAG: 50S ribosomal protein L11 methyltransferase [Myxococcales bacterium]|nr:50S ribosomal protein L11 methyltransferase [Myxococcales bacterium]
MQTQWATLTLHLRLDSASGTSSEDQVDALAALLGEDERISGVEVRDATTLGGSSDDPQLIVYTDPAAIEALRPDVAELARRLGIDLTIDAAIRDDDDWRDSWKQFYAPMRLGGGALLLRPSWIPREPGDPELEVVLDPGRAFGTGQHESTRLCLELLCRLAAAGRRPRRVLDLGCGSGILALSAARLFGPLDRLCAVDFDPEATETTAENAAINHVDGIEIVTGTIDDVAGDFDLILANIRPSVLIPAAAAITGHLAAGGDLLCSGILIEEGDEVAAPYLATEGLTDRGRETAGDWVALHFARSAG